jgi:type II secretory pathway pseudopilin PulG
LPRCQAFSLVELLIATALSTLLLVALISSWRALWTAQNRSKDKHYQQEAGNALIDRIHNDLFQVSESQFPGPAVWARPLPASMPLNEPVPVLRLTTHAPLTITGQPNPPSDGMTTVLFDLLRKRPGAPLTLNMTRMSAVYASSAPGSELDNDRMTAKTVSFHLPIQAWKVSFLDASDQWVEHWETTPPLPSAVHIRLEFGGSNSDTISLERTLILPAGSGLQP